MVPRSARRRKLRKLIRRPRAFFADAIANRYDKPEAGVSYRRLFLIEEMRAEGDSIRVCGRGVGGFPRLSLPYSAVDAVLVKGTRRYRFPMRDMPRADLADREGFAFEIDVARLEPGTYTLRFYIPSLDRECGHFDNIRTYRYRGPLHTASQVVDVGVRKHRLLKSNAITFDVRRRGSVRQLFNRMRSHVRGLGTSRYAAARSLYLASRPLFADREIWLIGERGDTAQDSALHLFKYLRQQRPDIEAYYLIDRDASDRDKVAPFGNVIAKGSFRHLLYFLNASVLINPYDVDAYMMPRGFDRQVFRRELGDIARAKRVFLQHGVTHNNVAKALHSNNAAFDMVCCSSDEELDYVSEACGYGDRAVITGMPRFDALVDAPTDDPFVLLMPTWRRWIVNPSYARGSSQNRERFAESNYFRFFHRLLSSPDLERTLESAGMTLKFYPHYEIQPFIDMFPGSERVEILDKEAADVQLLLRQARLLVTDYSSVFFDFAIMRKPVIHAAFDEDEFYAKQYGKGYFDLRSHGFGPVCQTPDQVVAQLAWTAQAGMSMSPGYRQRVDRFFSFPEGRCCESTTEKIEQLLRPPRRVERLVASTGVDTHQPVAVASAARGALQPLADVVPFPLRRASGQR